MLDFARLAGNEPPRDYGKGCEAQRIRYVIGQLEKRVHYEVLTRVAKAKWTKVLKHNAYDVNAMAALCHRIATDLGSPISLNQR